MVSIASYLAGSIIISLVIYCNKTGFITYYAKSAMTFSTEACL